MLANRSGYTYKRFAFLLMLAVGMIWADRQGIFNHIKHSFNYVVMPVHMIVQAPMRWFESMSQRLEDNQILRQENQKLHAQLLLYKANLQSLKATERENRQLHHLLNSSQDLSVPATLGKLLQIKTEPMSHYILVNRGSRHGIHEGQAVMDGFGVVGLVSHVSPNHSKVLLMTSPNMAVPIESLRSGYRTIAYGIGDEQFLQIKHVPITADLAVGDTVVTSGLGGHYLPGYPVGMITKVTTDESKNFKSFVVRPQAKIHLSRFVLMVDNKQNQSNL